MIRYYCPFQRAAHIRLVEADRRKLLAVPATATTGPYSTEVCCLDNKDTVDLYPHVVKTFNPRWGWGLLHLDLVLMGCAADAGKPITIFRDFVMKICHF